jgi:hypothetical protein
MLLQEFVTKLVNTPGIGKLRTVELLTYISNLKDQNPSINVMDTVQLKMMDIYLNHLICPPYYITFYLLSSHYKLIPNAELSRGKQDIVFDVTMQKIGEEKYFDAVYTDSILQAALKIKDAGYSINCRIRDPWSVGQVVWYDPFNTEMSVRWNNENSYTVRNLETTRKMSHDLVLYGEPQDGTITSKEEVFSMR